VKIKMVLLAVPLLVACSFGLYSVVKTEAVSTPSQSAAHKRILTYQPVKFGDTSGFLELSSHLQPVKDPGSFESIRDAYEGLDRNCLAGIDKRLASSDLAV